MTKIQWHTFSSLCRNPGVFVFACTLSLLLHAPWLGHGETLHDLILLPSLWVFRIHLIRRPLQHATVKGVAVSSARFLWPRHTIYWTEGKINTGFSIDEQMHNLYNYYDVRRNIVVRNVKGNLYIFVFN